MNMSRCPICTAPTVPDHAPFCSRGCKDRDLLQWLGEGYRLPGETIDTESLDSRPDTD
ncbi:DNA gyrase inhibitor YacG [Sphingomonas sp. NPDC079357]|uniref:DNA gyrase inhibitor YacG n=1 Tax=Sphingomonas sp. NPDC079357 TaxID=3364518 RepID=UPI00384EF529